MSGLAGYRIERTLGAGCLGELLLVEGTSATGGRILMDAIDVLPDFALPARTAVEMAAVEASKLPHAGAAKVGGVLQDGGRIALTWEVAGAAPIAEWIREHPMGIGKLWEMLGPALEFLLFAHRRGVPHGRLSPGLLLTGGRTVQILGLAIARRADAFAADPAPHLRPPERGPASSAGDVFTLGLLLHQLVAGRLPWAATATAPRIEEMKRRGLEPSRALPPALMEPITAALHPDPSRRPDLGSWKMDLQAAVWSSPEDQVGGAVAPLSRPNIPAVPAGDAMPFGGGGGRSPVRAPSPPKAPEPLGPSHEAIQTFRQRIRESGVWLVLLGVIAAGVLAFLHWTALPAEPEELDDARLLVQADLRRGRYTPEAARQQGWLDLCDRGYEFACSWPRTSGDARTALATEHCADRDPVACLALWWIHGARAWAPVSAEQQALADEALAGACRWRWRTGCTDGHRAAGLDALDEDATGQLDTWCNDNQGIACTLLGEAAKAPGARMLRFDQGCRRGDAAGCGLQGDARLASSEAEQRAKAPGAWTQGCEEGDAAACNALGKAQLDGALVARNAGEALNGFEKACRGGLATACEVWSGMAMGTDLGEPNLPEAAKAARLGCDVGHAPSCARANALCRDGTAEGC